MAVLMAHLEDEIDTLRTLENYEDKTSWAKWTVEVTNMVVKKAQTPDGMVGLSISS